MDDTDGPHPLFNCLGQRVADAIFMAPPMVDSHGMPHRFRVAPPAADPRGICPRRSATPASSPAALSATHFAPFFVSTHSSDMPMWVHNRFALWDIGIYMIRKAKYP
jgi:hypothetical protein